MGKDWDNFSSKEHKSRQNEKDAAEDTGRWLQGRGTLPYSFSPDAGRSKKERDAFIAFLREVMTEALRVLKPGGHALIWALPRTSHWTATALEDAGFEVRDNIYHLFSPESKIAAFYSTLSQEQRNLFEQILDSQDTPSKLLHCFGSGFPKSHNISVAIDKLQGAEREVIGTHDTRSLYDGNNRTSSGITKDDQAFLVNTSKGIVTDTAPATPEAQRWQGYGTALKPSCEEWILCRKPLAESSIAAQVLATGTGGLNIAQTRISHNEPQKTTERTSDKFSGVYTQAHMRTGDTLASANPQGRFPSHLLLSHSLWCVPRGIKRVRGSASGSIRSNSRSVYGEYNKETPLTGYADSEGMETVEAYDCAPDCPIAELDRQSGVRKSNARPNCYGKEYQSNAIRTHGKYGATQYHAHDDQGGASRYFTNFPPDGSVEHSHEGIEDPFTCYYDGFHYVTCPFEAAPFPPDDYTPFLYQSKASRTERNRGLPTKVDGALIPECEEGFTTVEPVDFLGTGIGGNGQAYETTPVANSHPTVKPLALMRWLIRLITPPDGIVLDPFCGSGSTCVAAIHEQKHFIGIEQDESYVNIANARIEYARTHEPDVVQVATKKVRGSHDNGYLIPRNATEIGFTRNGSGVEPAKGYTDSEGMEEVEDWDCAPDCPVRILGEQSGVSKSGAHKPYENKSWDSPAHMFSSKARDYNNEASTGTAARYFQQFAPDLWTQDMHDAEEVFIAEGGYEGEVGA